MTTLSSQINHNRLADIERDLSRVAGRLGAPPLGRPTQELAHELLALVGAMHRAGAANLLDRADKLARDIGSGRSDVLLKYRLTAFGADVARAAEERGIV